MSVGPQPILHVASCLDDDDVMSMLELKSTSTMRREEVAKQLRQIADSLERHNDLEFKLDGIRYTVDVPNEVSFEVELELGADGNEFEMELKW